MSYDYFESDVEMQNDAACDAASEYDKDPEGYESVSERYENPAAELFGKEGSELPDGVTATDYQTDENGITSRLLDVDGDGIYETLELSHSENGVVDGVLYRTDVNGDGVADREEEFFFESGSDSAGELNPTHRTVRVDLDGDGYADAIQVQEKSTDASGFSEKGFTPAESYIFDPELGDWREVSSDADGKQIVDSAVKPFGNDDGYDEDYGDTDDADYVEMMKNRDAEEKAEMSRKASDNGGDATPVSADDGKDSAPTTKDSTGDSYTEQYFDMNRDGMDDYGVFRTTSDVDGDGVKESYYIETCDIDGDGYVDAKLICTDFDNDGRYDLQQVFKIDAYTGEAELVSEQDISDPDRGDMYYELKTFDPENCDPKAVTGDPEKALELWEYQGDTNRCAVYSQMFVIEEMTGVKLDIDDVAAYASERGWFDEAYGTRPEDMNKILDAYGIPNELKTGCDMNEIESALQDGKRVIVAVDAEEYGAGENDDVYVPNDGANHAVEVVGIDRSDPEHPMVILNDSGHVNGKGAMVPLDEFVDAWDDSNNLAVICG